MKIICAWCKKLLGYKCPLCDQPLDPPLTPWMRKEYLICAAQATPIIFKIANMNETHTICESCRARVAGEVERRLAEKPERLSPEDKANLAAQANPQPGDPYKPPSANGKSKP
jgi:hypothetical protein